jgi:guanine nucleotide-binding protein G(I)/G(S)/G(T) subunit beta-1
MSVAELKERHAVATETVSELRERLKEKRLSLLDTDGAEFLEFLGFSFRCVYVLCFLVFGVAQICLVCVVVSIAVAGYSRSQGRTPVSFGPTDLVCCRTLQGHTGKVLDIRNVNVFSFF